MHNSMKYLNAMSVLLGQAAMLLICLLVISMLYEVAARYIFQAPTLWAFDLSYMFNGSLFLLAGAIRSTTKPMFESTLSPVNFHCACNRASMPLYTPFWQAPRSPRSAGSQRAKPIKHSLPVNWKALVPGRLWSGLSMLHWHWV